MAPPKHHKTKSQHIKTLEDLENQGKKAVRPIAKTPFEDDDIDPLTFNEYIVNAK